MPTALSTGHVHTWPTGASTNGSRDRGGWPLGDGGAGGVKKTVEAVARRRKSFFGATVSEACRLFAQTSCLRHRRSEGDARRRPLDLDLYLFLREAAAGKFHHICHGSFRMRTTSTSKRLSDAGISVVAQGRLVPFCATILPAGKERALSPGGTDRGSRCRSDSPLGADRTKNWHRSGSVGPLSERASRTIRPGR